MPRSCSCRSPGSDAASQRAVTTSGAPLARIAPFYERRHVFALGREGQPVEDAYAVAQRGVINALAPQPFEQRPLGRVAQRVVVAVEKGGGVCRDEFIEQPLVGAVVTQEFLHAHAVLRKCSRLVGADNRYGPHCLAGVHLPHEVVGLEHAAHRERQRKGDAHGQPLRYGHDDHRHRDHEAVEQDADDMGPRRFGETLDQEGLADKNDEDENRKRDSYFADLVRQPGQLSVQGCLFTAFDGRLFRHAAGFGGVADGRDDHHAVSVADGRAAQQPVRRIGRFGVEQRLIDKLVGLGFAREGRFIDLQRNGLDQLSVGRNRLAGFEAYQIADDHLAAGNFGHDAVAPHLDGLVVVDLIQPAEAPHGVPFEEKAHARGQQNGADDADGLGVVPLDEGHDQRERGGNKQNDDDRIAELLGKEFPGGVVARRSDDVLSMGGATGRRLFSGKTFRIVGDHFYLLTVSDISGFRCCGGIPHGNSGEELLPPPVFVASLCWTSNGFGSQGCLKAVSKAVSSAVPSICPPPDRYADRCLAARSVGCCANIHDRTFRATSRGRNLTVP